MSEPSRSGRVVKRRRSSPTQNKAAWNGRASPSDSDEAFDHKVGLKVASLRVEEAARQRIASERAGEGFAFPEPGRTLADDLAAPQQEQKFTVDQLHTAGGNTLLVAQYKTGKTTLVMNLIKSLADGEPFLGQFEVAELTGKVAYWNYELSADMSRGWMRDIEVAHTERVAEPLHLRGVHLPFWRDDVAKQAIRWLRDNEVEFWILDPAAGAMRGLVDNENDNSQLAAFTDALDTIKREAGVRDLLLPTHMGRATFEQDQERSRGGTRLEDWMDTGWYLTKDGPAADSPRALRAMGRDVDVPAIDLTYDMSDRRLTVSGWTRNERRDEDGRRRAVEALMTMPGHTAGTAALKEAIGGRNDGRQQKWIASAIAEGYIERRYEDGSPVDESDRKQGTTLLCTVTAAGRDFLAPYIKTKKTGSDA